MSSAMLAAIQQSVLRPAIFVQMAFASGTVYVWSGTGSISWNGHTWVGVGSFGGISTIDEGNNVEAKGVVLSLSGIDTGLLADTLQEFQSGAPVTAYLGLFDSGGSLIADPLTTWSGLMDQPTIDVGGSSATISIACESRLIELNVAADRRLSQADQSIDFPGDLAFEFVAGCQNAQISWGRIPSPTIGPFVGIF
jgi:hypothetical protein